jgi:hypothetical protein
VLRLGDGTSVSAPSAEDLGDAVDWLFGEAGRIGWLQTPDRIVQFTATSKTTVLLEEVTGDDVTVLAQQAGRGELLEILIEAVAALPDPDSAPALSLDVAFETHPTDRSRNATGKLTEDQRRRLDDEYPHRIGCAVVIALAWLSPLVVGLVAFIVEGGDLPSNARTVLLGTAGGWLVLGAALTLWNSRHFLFRTVFRIEGEVRSMMVPGLEPWSWITLEGIDMPTGDRGRAFAEGGRYRIYYVKRGGMSVPVSAEPLDAFTQPARAPTETGLVRRRRMVAVVAMIVLGVAGLWFTPLLIPLGVFVFFGAPWLIMSKLRDAFAHWWARRRGVAIEYSRVMHGWRARRGAGAKQSFLFQAGHMVFDIGAILLLLAVMGGVLVLALLITNGSEPLHIFGVFRS